MFKKFTSLMLGRLLYKLIASKLALFSVSVLKAEKFTIDPYNSELYRFKFGAFLRHSVFTLHFGSHNFVYYYSDLRTH